MMLPQLFPLQRPQPNTPNSLQHLKSMQRNHSHSEKEQQLLLLWCYRSCSLCRGHNQIPQTVYSIWNQCNEIILTVEQRMTLICFYIIIVACLLFSQLLVSCPSHSSSTHVHLVRASRNRISVYRPLLMVSHRFAVNWRIRVPSFLLWKL